MNKNVELWADKIRETINTTKHGESLTAQDVSISRSNAKMGAGVASFSLPPFLTCAKGCKCLAKCYALKMAKIRPNVGEAWARNLAIWESNPQAVEMAITSSAMMSRYFRYFVGGDLPDVDFLEMACKIAERVPSCRFLMFTKKYNIVNAFIEYGGIIPDNLVIIFSEWQGMKTPNRFNLPTSKVIYKGEEAPADGLVCGGNCAECLAQGVGCWQLKKGEKIHFYEH